MQTLAYPQSALSMARLLMAAISAAALTACGGGGGDDDTGRTYFAIEGTQSAGGVPVTICIDNIAYTDPATASGQQIAANLARYYGITGGYRSLAGTGNSCREKFVVLNHLLSVDDYNKKVLPFVAAAPPPAPAPTPAPAPSPSPSPAPAPTPSPAPAPTPAPAPPPAPSPIACPAGGGNGTNGLQLFGQSSFSGLGAAAGSTGTVTYDPGEVSFDSTPGSISGSLRAQLWAVPSSYAGGNISGYIVATYAIRFTDGTNQLRHGESANLSAQVLNASSPPRGSYCMVTTFEQYATSCSATDGYCIVDWQQFSPSQTFQ